MKKILSLFAVLLLAGSMMAQTKYCDVPSGHLGDANFGDTNACVKLTITQSSDEGHVDVKVAMNREKSTTSKIDYLYVLYNGLPYTAGTDDNGDALDELTAKVNVGSATSGDLMLQYSNPSWGGRWQIDLSNVDFTNICDAYPGEYTWCLTTNSLLHRDFGDAYLTWATKANGNVEITIAGATFRNGGFENEGTWAASWNVISGTGHSTVESADVYFTGGTLSADNLTYTLTKKTDAVIPSNAIIQFKGHAFSWKIGEHNEYFLNPDMLYSYNVNCDFLATPANVAVTDAGVITFDAVDDAEKYTANIYSGTTLLASQEVTSGATLSYTSYVAATLTVKVVASAAGKSDSPESDAATWNLAASPLPASVFCETAGVVTDNQNTSHPVFSINTLTNGNVTIEIGAGEGTPEGAKFRGNNGMNGTFKLNGSAADFSNYFTKSLSDDKKVVTLALVSATNKPALGSVIDYSGQIECASSIQGNDWSNYDLLGYLYGTKCPDVNVEGVTLNYSIASVHKTENITLVATITPDNATNKNVTWTSSDEDVATVSGGVVTGVAEGEATIKATTEDGSFIATCTVTVTAPRSNRPATAAPTPTVEASKVMSIYSDTYTPCVTIGDINAFNQGWWDNPSIEDDAIGENHMLHYSGRMTGMIGWEHAHVNIGTMNMVHVDIWAQVDGTITMGPTSANPTVVASKQLTLVGGQWNSFDLDLTSDLSQTLDLTNMFQNQFTGYSAQENLYVDNYYYYTTLDADTENPVMTSATLESVSYLSATINVAATDNRGVTKYLVKNGTNEVGTYSPANGKIKVTGLNVGTAYTLTIFAMDATENVSTAGIDVELTTLTAPAAAADPNMAGKAYRAIYAPSLTSAIAHDFILANWGSASGEKINDKNYILYSTEGNSSIVWGENNAGNNAIVAKDEYKGDKGGVDVNEMEYMHFDIWSDAACNSLIVVVNDHNLGGAQTLVAGWNSIDIALSEFAATPNNNYLLDNVAWIKFVGLNGVNNAALTNVYFWKQTAYTLTTADNDFYGLYLDYEATIPAGIEAYTGVLNTEETELTITKVDGSVLPAQTAVIVKSPATTGAFEFVESNTNATAIANNSLKGVTTETAVSDLAEDGKTVLTLGSASGVVGFRQPAGSKIKAHRVYLLVTTPSNGTAPAPIRIIEAATAVEDVEAGNVVKFFENGQLFIKKNGVVYNAMGQIVK